MRSISAVFWIKAMLLRWPFIGNFSLERIIFDEKTYPSFDFFTLCE